MNFYQQLGTLVLGTRLRRLSDYFLAEVNKTYAVQGIDFEASWFGVFYLLDSRNEVSMVDLAETLEVSHSAISQLIKNLTQKQLVYFTASKDDARKKIILLTPKGEELLLQIKPIWNSLDKTMQELLKTENCEDVLDRILKIETAFNKISLNERLCLNTEKIPSQLVK